MQPAPGRRHCGRKEPKPAPTGPAGPPSCPASPCPDPGPGGRGGWCAPPGSAACCRRAVPASAPGGRVGASSPGRAGHGPPAGAGPGSRSPWPAASASPARLRNHPAPGRMADRLNSPCGIRRVHAQRCLAQVDRDAGGDARRDQDYLPLAVRARQHPLDRVRRRGEVDHRDLPAPERFPLDPDCRLQEIFPLQPAPASDQQLSGRLCGQPALRPRPDRPGEVIEARSKAGSPSIILTGNG